MFWQGGENFSNPTILALVVRIFVGVNRYSRAMPAMAAKITFLIYRPQIMLVGKGALLSCLT